MRYDTKILFRLMKNIAYFYISLAFLFVSCNSENPSVVLKSQTITDISYGTDSQQKFDLYLPAYRNAATKTLILVHGGSWVQGDKASMTYLVDLIKQYLPEYAIANINYRLASSGNPAFPMQIDDINSVVTQLKTGNYGISNNFGFIGFSAGAHLSLLYSYAYNHDIKIICSIVGPTNFTDANYSSNPSMVSRFESVTGVNYAENTDYYNQISPLYWASSTSQHTFMIYGNDDSLIPISQGQSLHDKLSQLGVYNEYYLYNGGHGNWSTPDLIDAYGKMMTFIKNEF